MRDLVDPPWTATLTNGEHSLLLYAVVGTALALLATLLQVRFATREVQGGYRTASLTANAVVAIAFATYVLLVVAIGFGYERTATGWVPTPYAPLAWWLRYADWSVTVPLLVVEVLAVSALASTRRAMQARVIGMSAGFAMILLGFLGGVVVGDGARFGSLALFGLLASVCFLVLAVVIVLVVVRSMPRMPPPARGPYRGAAVVLLTVWFVYPVVYGLQGITSGGGWAVTAAIALSAADLIAKVGFGSLIHRTAVFRSRADENASPATVRRPRQPEADSLWVEDQTRLEVDSRLRRDA